MSVAHIGAVILCYNVWKDLTVPTQNAIVTMATLWLVIVVATLFLCMRFAGPRRTGQTDLVRLDEQLNWRGFMAPSQGPLVLYYRYSNHDYHQDFDREPHYYLLDGGAGADAPRRALPLTYQALMIRYADALVLSRDRTTRDELCTICLAQCDDTSGSKTQPILETTCCHRVYHYACLAQWLRYKQTCPTCRQKFPQSRRNSSSDDATTIYNNINNWELDSDEEKTVEEEQDD
jgi:hypothetical protein